MYIFIIADSPVPSIVVKVAHAFGVPVEAEIGELQRLDSDGSVLENKNTADPEQVRQFLGLCSPDTLAIGIGNAHGYYKGEPDIKLEVLRKVREFTDIPFVLHGCTGMKEEIIRESISLLEAEPVRLQRAGGGRQEHYPVVRFGRKSLTAPSGEGGISRL